MHSSPVEYFSGTGSFRGPVPDLVSFKFDAGEMPGSVLRNDRVNAFHVFTF